MGDTFKYRKSAVRSYSRSFSDIRVGERKEEGQFFANV